MDAQTIQRRRWVILGVLVVGLLAIVIDNTVLNVALKTIAEPGTNGGLGASQSQLEWAINSYTLVFAGLLFTFGVIGDRIGRKRMMIIGLGLFGLASLLSAYSHTPDQLILARAAMGLGGAAVMPQTLSIISNVFEPRERAKAIGIWTSAVGIGVAIGPVLGGVLLSHFWWGSVFLINVPVTIAGAIAAIAFVPESRNPNPGKVDYLGVLASVVGLILLVYGIVQGGDNGNWLGASVLGPIFGGLAVLALFAWHETRTSHPALDVRLFRDRRLSASVGAIALLFFGMGGVFFFTSFYLQNVRGYSPLDAGLLAIPFAVGQLLSSPRSAALVSRYGAKAVTAGGMVLNGLAIAGYSFLGTTTPIVLLGVLYFLQGMAMGAAMPALGSVLAQAYRSHMSPTLAHLPAASRDVAAQSISATQGVAAHLGAAGRFLLAPAGVSYVDAMRITTVIAAVVIVAGAAVVIRWMPGKPKVNMDEIIAAEVAAEVAKAEQELAALRRLQAPRALETLGSMGTLEIQRGLGTERALEARTER